MGEIFIGTLMLVYSGMLCYMWSVGGSEGSKDRRTLKFTTK